MPEQCPECARFLSNDLVESLADAPAPCPQCETTLTAAMFAEDPVTDAAPDSTADTVDGATAPASDATASSVRPPDLDAPLLAPDGHDPLAGWDEGSEVSELPGLRRDQRGLDTEAMAVVAGGAGVLGALLGALVADRRGRGAVLGGLLAALAAVLGVQASRR